MMENESTDEDQDDEDLAQEAVRTDVPIVPYAIDDILKEGCFLERAEIEQTDRSSCAPRRT